MDIELAQALEENAKLQKQIENLQIMLQAEREVRCNDEYLKKVTELEAYNEKLLNSDIEKHNKIVSLEAQIEKMKCFLDEYLSWYKNNSYSINDLAKEAEEILDELKE